MCFQQGEGPSRGLLRNYDTLNFMEDQGSSSTHLDVVSLPGLLPEQHDGDAGEDAGQQHVQAPALAQTLRVLVDLAQPAAHPAHA